MKCTIKSLLALMAGAVMLGSCNDLDYFETTKSDVAKTGNMSFTATVDGADSRASFTGDSLSFMKPNSEISVLSDGQNNKFTMNDEGIFIGNCDESDEYYAVFPYNEMHSCVPSTSFTNLSIEWNGAEQTVNENYAPMLAHVANVSKGTQNVPLTFQNLCCSYIKLTTDYVCKSITLKSRCGEKLAAKTLYVGFDCENKPHVYYYNMPSETITLTGKDGGNIEAGTYYIPVISGKLYYGVDMTFTNQYNEKTYTKTFTDLVDLAYGEVIDFGKINIKSDMVHLAGKGTEADPYIIHDFDQFMEMHDFVNNSTGGGDCYKLVDDIDCQGREISSVGNHGHMFCGTFDGGNHTIKNFCIKGTIEYYHPRGVWYQISSFCSLFGAIKGATIKNLTIDSPSFNPGNGDNITVSPFVGVTYCAKDNYDTSRCRILNCKLTGDCTITQTSNEKKFFCNLYGFIYGGFVGCSQSNLEITDCSTDMRLNIHYLGKLSAQSNCLVGGYIGFVQEANNYNDKTGAHDGIIKFNNCRNNSPCISITVGNVINGVYAGGFIGGVRDGLEYDASCFFQNCVNNASFDITANNVEVNLGGFVGNHDSDGDYGYDPYFKNCVNNGNLLVYGGAKKTKMGGFTGYNYNNDTKYINCANTGKLFTSAGDNAPGAISYESGACTNCYNCSTYDYKIIVESPGKMTNTGHKSIDEVVGIMNSTELVWKNGDICNWRKKTVNGREILDLYTVKGPNIPQ